MLLECRIRRKDGTVVDMPNAEGQAPTRYHFKPVDPSRADSPHVAEVADNKHLSRFIAAAPECYVIFEGTTPKVALTKPDTAPAPVAPTQPVEAVQTADTNGNGVLSVTELAEGISAGKFTPEQLRELLAQEEESGSPRKGFVKAITQALKG